MLWCEWADLLYHDSSPLPFFLCVRSSQRRTYARQGLQLSTWSFLGANVQPLMKLLLPHSSGEMILYRMTSRSQVPKQSWGSTVATNRLHNSRQGWLPPNSTKTDLCLSVSCQNRRQTSHDKAGHHHASYCLTVRTTPSIYFHSIELKLERLPEVGNIFRPTDFTCLLTILNNWTSTNLTEKEWTH